MGWRVSSRPLGVSLGLILLIAAISIPQIAAALGGTELWTSRYGRGEGIGYSVGVSPDGARVFMTGTTGADFITIAYAADSGAELWTTRYNGPADLPDHAFGLVVSPDGARVYVTGESGSSRGLYGKDFATIAYDAGSGATLWVARYSGPKHSADIPRSLAVSPDGQTLFVGGGGPGAGFVTIAYDANSGQQRWIASQNGGGLLRVSPDGARLYASEYGAVLCYDAHTGDRLWESAFGSPASGALPFSLGLSRNGRRLYAAGTVNGEFAIAAAYRASTGSEIWRSQHHHGTSLATSLAVAPDGNQVFVTGYSRGSTSGDNYMTAAYDAETGLVIWVRRYDGPAHDADEAFSIGVSPDGAHVYVTGESYRVASGFDVATISYDSGTGAREWLDTYSGSGAGSDWGRSLGVSPNGSKLYLTGSSAGPTGSPDCLTIAYVVG
jgi:outer membrane protein assembly factor BamB